MKYDRRITRHWDSNFVKNSLNLRPDEFKQFKKITFNDNVRDIVLFNAHGLEVVLPTTTSLLELAGSVLKPIRINENQGTVILNMGTDISNIEEVRYHKNVKIMYTDTTKRHPLVQCPICRQSLIHSTLPDNAYVMRPFQSQTGPDGRLTDMSLSRYDTVHICALMEVGSVKEAYNRQKEAIFTLS